MSTSIEPVSGTWRDYGVTEADSQYLLELAASAFHLVQSGRVRRRLVSRQDIEWQRLSRRARRILARLGNHYFISREFE